MNFTVVIFLFTITGLKTFISQLNEDIKPKDDYLKYITNFVGIWENDQYPKCEVVIRLRKDKLHGFVIEHIDPKNPVPSEHGAVVKQTVKGGLVAYVDEETGYFKEYYIIEKNGDLSVYDHKGFIVRYKRLK